MFLLLVDKCFWLTKFELHMITSPLLGLNGNLEFPTMRLKFAFSIKLHDSQFQISCQKPKKNLEEVLNICKYDVYGIQDRFGGN